MKIYCLILGILLGQLVLAQDTTSNILIKKWSLQECINYAIENNISVKSAKLDKQAAEVNYDASKSALLPNLNGNISQNFSNGNTIDRITSDYVSQQKASTNIGINTSITIFQGNQLINKIRKNKLQLEQTDLEIEEIQNNIKISILENYLQALYDKESIITAQNNLNISEEQLSRSKELLNAGTIALKDYTEAQSQVATNKYKLIQAKNNYQQSIISMKQLLELNPMDEMDFLPIEDDEINLIIITNKIDIYNNALSHLPEIEASKLNIEINKKELAIAKGAYLPSLSLSGSIGSGYTSIDNNSFSTQMDVNFNQGIGFSLKIPIFNRKATKSAVKLANINIEKAEIQQQSKEKTLFKQIDQAYQNAMSAQEQLAAAKSSQEAAQQSFKLATEKYKLGGISTTDLLVSQNTYANAQQTYLQAKYMNILYYQLLQYYQGKL